MTLRARPRLAFVSPVFLLPADAGGKIRTGNILRGLKGGAFETTLISPAAADGRDHAAAMAEMADHFECWAPAAPLPRWCRAGQLVGDLPANVQPELRGGGVAQVARLLAAGRFDAAVFDFVHAAVLMPPQPGVATLCFTHNVEAEIFARHAQHAGSALMRRVWRSQAAKMQRYERSALNRFDTVIAVSDRDAQHFRSTLDAPDVQAIPTAVDLDYFGWQAPVQPAAGHGPTVVFTGSMDWAANVDGVGFFLQQVWPLVLQRRPDANFVVVGRNPPASLLRQGQALPGVRFTGFVDDVRPHVRSAQVFVIPLRVGGGTRIKAFEALAMGCPVVSTTIGIEGLDLEPGRHFLMRDTAQQQAEAIVSLLADPALCLALSRAGRQHVERHFGHRAVARVFERICLDTLARRGERFSPVPSLRTGVAAVSP